ncbi:hypothetical protein BDP55DRAFT_638007 [Colletotrichum godetiae]|uniref:Uncharacterized protein n=1 Tax=Colletotrichum godetiae TaxID=1209918 RepID=A0AAJ0EN70_9PEZI|nr:uncharacterized protein BDP55DRAFT_638007 [Colletotrichum godetiae]KAK1658261.1 hypothetical protein BDP55DRAFT_638007 [Colletotrichum godetiae]
MHRVATIGQRHDIRLIVSTCRRFYSTEASCALDRKGDKRRHSDGNRKPQKRRVDCHFLHSAKLSSWFNIQRSKSRPIYIRLTLTLWCRSCVVALVRRQENRPTKLAPRTFRNSEICEVTTQRALATLCKSGALPWNHAKIGGYDGLHTLSPEMHLTLLRIARGSVIGWSHGSIFHASKTSGTQRFVVMLYGVQQPNQGCHDGYDPRSTAIFPDTHQALCDPVRGEGFPQVPGHGPSASPLPPVES